MDYKQKYSEITRKKYNVGKLVQINTNEDDLPSVCVCVVRSVYLVLFALLLMGSYKKHHFFFI